ncbi:hypothetical protein CXG81DRAFT_27491 [Caulochytrium protostelioides]|uniref:Uncharacterized protein n=1 Tax=Caulochytrium protostelioides TaxID=1555241 RepID=A0A4P9X409_9FUNG|nr:hypothetical protein CAUPRSCDRAFT_11690 [Caulochytrium protostelioides]RKO99774.1 hypothetical protein CXG81DRAFT_27491 [Caulochytrium protostelioides]|eukprot:RKO99774.1 hypothetical protein CXG81DRAFT_27491 [Caulochytrium protostelioides]
MPSLRTVLMSTAVAAAVAMAAPMPASPPTMSPPSWEVSEAALATHLSGVLAVQGLPEYTGIMADNVPLVVDDLRRRQGKKRATPIPVTWLTDWNEQYLSHVPAVYLKTVNAPEPINIVSSAGDQAKQPLDPSTSDPARLVPPGPRDHFVNDAVALSVVADAHGALLRAPSETWVMALNPAHVHEDLSGYQEPFRRPHRVNGNYLRPSQEAIVLLEKRRLGRMLRRNHHAALTLMLRDLHAGIAAAGVAADAHLAADSELSRFVQHLEAYYLADDVAGGRFAPIYADTFPSVSASLAGATVAHRGQYVKMMLDAIRPADARPAAAALLDAVLRPADPADPFAHTLRRHPKLAAAVARVLTDVQTHIAEVYYPRSIYGDEILAHQFQTYGFLDDHVFEELPRVTPRVVASRETRPMLAATSKSAPEPVRASSSASTRPATPRQVMSDLTKTLHDSMHLKGLKRL